MRRPEDYPRKDNKLGTRLVPATPFRHRRGPMSVLVTLALATLALCIACGSSSGPPETEALDEYQRGVELQEQGNLMRALEAYSAALRLNPQLASGYAARGYVYYVFQNPNPALADLNRAIKLDPEMAAAYHYRGLVLAHIDNTDGAVLNLTKAIQLDPNLVNAYYDRARVNFEQEDVDAAIEDLSTAITLDPRDARFYFTRGQVYIFAGDTASAISDLEQVLALTQDEAFILPAKQMLSRLR